MNVMGWSAGGGVFWLLVLLLAAAAVLFFLRLLGLRRAHIDYVDFIHGVGNLLSGGKVEEALVLCEETPVPVARVVAAAIRRQGESARQIREAVDMAGRVEVGRIERRFAALALIAQVAPVLGLFGALIGFIRTVEALNAQALVVRGDLLAGIMAALVPAAAGLFTCLVAQVMYAVLRVRFERLVLELEAAASDVLALLAVRPKGAV